MVSDIDKKLIICYIFFPFMEALMNEFLEMQKGILIEKRKRYNDPAFRSGRIPEAARMKDVGLAYIEQALKRIGNCTYEICIDCGKTINRSRLITVQGAIRCIQCQTEVEQNVGLN